MKVFETEVIDSELALNMCVHGGRNFFYSMLLLIEQFLI